MEKKYNKFTQVLLFVLPLIVAAGIQVLVASIGTVIFSYYCISYDEAHGIEYYADSATGQIVNLYTAEQYSTFSAIVTFVSEAIMLICAVIWYMKIRKNEVGFKASCKIPVVISALILGVGLQGITSLILNAIFELSPSLASSYDELMGNMLDTTSPLMVISVCLLAPVAEELFFRGITESLGLRFFPAWLAIGGQAVLFGILHMNIVQFIYATLISIIFGIVAYEAKSVFPSMFIHIGVNASAEILTLLGIELSVFQMSIMGAVLCAVASIIFILYKKQQENQKKL